MTRNRYIVVLNDGEWKIEHGGELSARYRTQEEALLDALNAARRLDREAKTPKFLRKAQISGCGWNGPIAWDAYEHESAKARNDRLRLIQTIRRRGLDRAADRSRHPHKHAPALNAQQYRHPHLNTTEWEQNTTTAAHTAILINIKLVS